MICWGVFGSQNLGYPSHPKYTPLFNKFICATLPESTPLSQNISPPFQQLLYHATPPESSPPPPPPRIYPPFSTTLCDPPRIYPSLPEYTPLFNNYMYNIGRRSQNLPPPPPPSEYTLLSTTICEPPTIYPSFSEYTPFLQLYAIFEESTLSHWICPIF